MMSRDYGLGTSCSSEDVGLSYELEFSVFFLKIAANHSLELSVTQETQGGHEKIGARRAHGSHSRYPAQALSSVSVPLGQQHTVPCDSFLPGVQSPSASPPKAPLNPQLVWPPSAGIRAFKVSV